MPTSDSPQTRAPESTAEFTLKAVLAGVLLGLVFGAANAYVGLRVGLTVAASIPAAVMTVALFKLLRLKGTLLEANLSQTIGSASTSLASGVIFTIPALFLWGYSPSWVQVALLALCGGVFGLAAMIPLRRLLIVREHESLPYPEGRACAEVLRATTGSGAGSNWIFAGMGVGAAIKLLEAGLHLVPRELQAVLPVLPKAELAIELAPALIAVGFLLGYRAAGVIVSGALVAALVLTPLIAYLGEGLDRPLAPATTALVREMSASDLWKNYVRYVGAGAVAIAGLITIVKSLPAMLGALRSVFGGLSRGPAESAAEPSLSAADRDLPGIFIVGAILLVISSVAFVPGLLAGEPSLVQRLVCAAGVGLFGLVFVSVAARIVGLVGVSSQPTSAIALLTLIGIAGAFALLGWTDPLARAAVLSAGTIVAVAASKAGDISQDLKTGFLVGATPAKQQFGQLIGAACACWAVAATVLVLGEAYGFGSKELAAPQATLMKTIVEGVLSGELPWGLVLSGGGLSLGAFLCGIAPLAFAIGVYLPLASMAPIFLGGCMRALADRGRSVAVGASAGAEGGNGVLAASGMVAGEALTGIVIAGLVASGQLAKSAPALLPGSLGVCACSALFAVACAFLVRAGRRA